MTMKTGQLGTTDLKITWAGLGAWPIGGGGWEFVWGPQDDDRSIAPVHRELERAVNWVEDDIGVIVYSPIGSRLLTGRMTRARPEDFAKIEGGTQ